MSINGATKGTEFENEIEQKKTGEAQGAVLYASMSYIARSKGLTEAADTLMEIATDELKHAAIYSVLNNKVSQDIFETIMKIQPVEVAAESNLNEFSEKLQAIGTDVSQVITSIAKDEARHGEKLKHLIDILKK
ncbi:ferritin family protein [Clostridium felsineum]|uniref:Uncharacterized protein n=1 Tax=Clostridium felsineum TaxID=36839 RepID=A0A1S8L0X4_9CLOT|nr:ferritin family protein [Clostridium felsineum]MCR3758592.1 hypothetical protein [Clostridium felsineum]URZ04666.1 hypothetical protein CLAUR_047550 [Clostridium felsineum]URZ09185.1 hypothetical protein CLROS_046010 [Clostridium felsineum]URZ13871.1 hypothetical protein CROST_046490 [Clostridium felsineum]